MCNQMTSLGVLKPRDLRRRLLRRLTTNVISASEMALKADFFGKYCLY